MAKNYVSVLCELLRLHLPHDLTRLHYMMLCHMVLRDVTLRYVMSHYIMLHYMTLHHVTLHTVIIEHTTFLFIS